MRNADEQLFSFSVCNVFSFRHGKVRACLFFSGITHGEREKKNSTKCYTFIYIHPIRRSWNKSIGGHCVPAHSSRGSVSCFSPLIMRAPFSSSSSSSEVATFEREKKIFIIPFYSIVTSRYDIQQHFSNVITMELHCHHVDIVRTRVMLFIFFWKKKKNKFVFFIRMRVKVLSNHILEGPALFFRSL